MRISLLFIPAVFFSLRWFESLLIATYIRRLAYRLVIQLCTKHALVAFRYVIRHAVGRQTVEDRVLLVRGNLASPRLLDHIRPSHHHLKTA